MYSKSHLDENQKADLKDLVFSTDARSIFEDKLNECLDEETEWTKRKEVCEKSFLSLPLDGSVDSQAVILIIQDELERQGNVIKQEKKKWSRFLQMNLHGKEEWKSQFNSENSFDLERIKEVPIDSLFPFEKIRETTSRFSAKCPFHEERTPSFVIYKEQNRFHCFGCGVYGSVIDFVMLRDGVPFKTACGILA